VQHDSGDVERLEGSGLLQERGTWSLSKV